MLFIGVSTTQSFVHHIFSKWLQLVDKKGLLEGIDIKLDSEGKVYNDTVFRIKTVDNIVGGLITSHKVNIFKYAIELFSNIAEASQNLGEIGVIYKSGATLACDVQDTAAIEFVLNRLLPKQYWKNNAHALILGAGGAGVALAYVLLNRKGDIPSRIIITEVSKARAASVESILSKFDTEKRLQVISVKEREADVLVRNLPKGSLVVNATGMGKDRPGSPISSETEFPHEAIVWEFNYRGDLQFLQTAKEQEEARQLTVEDGWFYFVSAWAFALSKVFDFELDDDLLSAFEFVASTERNERR